MNENNEATIPYSPNFYAMKRDILEVIREETVDLWTLKDEDFMDKLAADMATQTILVRASPTPEAAIEARQNSDTYRRH